MGKIAHDEVRRAEDALASLAMEVDDRKEITWYSDRSSTALILGAFAKAYFGRNAERTLGLRLTLQMEGDGETFSWDLEVVVDGVAYPLPTEGSDWMSDRGSGKLWVQVDVPLSHRCPVLTQALASASQAQVRFERRGKSHDWTVPEAQLAALKRVHAVWSAMVAIGAPGRG
jgi:hypothetical protein